MFARRDFLYKRSHNIGAHLNLAARASPTLPTLDQVKTPSPSTSTPSDAKTTDVLTPLTPVVPAPKTTETSATPPAPATSSSPTPTTSPPSSSSSPSTSTSLSSSTPSSATLATSAAVSTPLALAPTTTSHASSVSTRVVTGTSFVTTPSLSPSSTSSAGSSSGTNTGAIVGGIAGVLVGIAVLGFLLRWCMRRQRSRDIDDFDAQAFKRQSVVLLDDPVESARPYNPRPPTMIERHNASPALAAQGGAGQNFYGNYGGHGQQPPYAPPEMIQSADSPPTQAYGAPPMGYASYPQQQMARQPSNVGYTGYDSQQQLTRQPSNVEYLTRQPSSVVGYTPPAPPGSVDPNAHYIDLNRSSVSPYQAAQYADISRQLGTTQSGPIPHEVPELSDDPLPSPFDDPVEDECSARCHLSSCSPEPSTRRGCAWPGHHNPGTTNTGERY
ncbi:hypothetical protein J3R83DRAFT_8626 [Lanmaoa asiatica]|nr:hypothetical protein J3R83DRAFT_8626 [Lanmaoa asiatica]